MTDEAKKPTLTKEASASEDFQIVIGEPVNGNLPVAAGATSPAAASAQAGGLTYQSAHEDERAEMDKVIASIDLTNPESVIALGNTQREQLAKIADEILDSIQPSVKLAFAEALRALIDAVRANSLDEIKKRVNEGVFRRAGSRLFNALAGKDNKVEASKKLITNFMTDITSTRKAISEMADKLQDQQVELNKNYARINSLGAAVVKAAQDMRVVRAATAEYIRRVEAGEITVLTDLQKQAEASGRQDDTEKLQLAQANWNNLRTQDGDLLASINVYDMNVANLAFTKQANLQNRMQTASALSTTVSEWKTQLALFATMTTENAAAQLIGVAGQLTAKSIEQNKEMFDLLVDSITARAAKGNYNLRQIMEAQNSMAAKLEEVGPKVEAQFKQLEEDKAALAASSAVFRKRIVGVYSKPNGVLGGPAPKP